MTMTSVPLSEPQKKKKTGNKYTQYFELFLLIKGTGSRQCACVSSDSSGLFLNQSEAS